jgi:hypothetical protein
MAGELPKGWDFWREYDLWFIRQCDRLTVVMIDGWRESVGVTAEIAEAERLGIPVGYMEVRDSSRT